MIGRNQVDVARGQTPPRALPDAAPRRIGGAHLNAVDPGVMCSASNVR